LRRKARFDGALKHVHLVVELQILAEMRMATKLIEVLGVYLA
jgi:hypothetical protein